MPIDAGNGLQIGNYPNYYWLVNTNPSSFTSTQNFDVEMHATNIGYPYDSDQNLRIIRRQDGSSQSNGWALQGNSSNYANYQVVTGTDTLAVVRTTSSIGGIVNEGTRFSVGVPSQAPSFTAPLVLAYTVLEGATLNVPVTAISRTIGATIASIAQTSGPAFSTYTATNASSGTLTFTPGAADGRTAVYPVVLTATDSKGTAVNITINVTVTDVNSKPVFTKFLPVVDTTAKAGNAFSFQYTATDADAGATLVYSIKTVTYTGGATATAPAITAGGLLTWSPVTADVGKKVTLLVEVTDGTDITQTTGSITVVGNTAPVFTKVLPATILFVGDKLTFTYEATDADGDALTFAFVDPKPGAMKISATTANSATIEWTPVVGDTAAYLIGMTVTDTKATATTSAQVTVKVTTTSVAGTVVYNVSNTGLAGATVTYTMGSTVYTATTTATGAYTLASVFPGTYTVTVAKTTNWGGVSSADALQAARSAASLVTLDALQTLAADVNNDGNVTNADALTILNRTVGKVTSFTKADWIFASATVVVGSTPATAAAIKGIATGDVNNSYALSQTLSKSVSYSNDEVQAVTSGKEVSVPVRVNASGSVSAFNLDLDYPASKMEYVGVSGIDGLFVNAQDGKLSIAWADLSLKNALELDGKSALVMVKFRATDLFGENEVNGMTLAGAEFVNEEGAVVKANVSSANLSTELPAEYSLSQNYPNPFNPSTKINYALPTSGVVNLSIYNALGQEVAKLVNNTQQEAGNFEVNFDASHLSSGVYIYRISVEGTKNFVQVKKMMLIK
jgi:hypothetical protein